MADQVSYRNPEGYEQYMGRWSTRLAPRFLDFAGLPGDGLVLDVGCGSGALCEAICAHAPLPAVVGLDPAEDLVAYARTRLRGTRAMFHVGDALALPFGEAAFDACYSLLILQEFSEPERLVSEKRRVALPGATVAACQWDFASGMPMLDHFWVAVAEVYPAGVPESRAGGGRPRGRTSEIALADLWRDCGLLDVETATIVVRQDFASFEDYWSPFLSGATPTSTFAAGLPRDVQGVLKETLRARLLGGREDGPLAFEARAVAVRGTAPGV